MGMQKVTREELWRFLELETKRKEVDRQSRNLAREISQLKTHFEQCMRDDDKESVVRYGFRLTFVDGRPKVSWKDEFIRVAGAEAADDVLADAPRPPKLEVSAPV